MSWEVSWGRMRNGNGHTKKKNQKKNPMRVTQAWDELGSELGENAQWQWSYQKEQPKNSIPSLG